MLTKVSAGLMMYRWHKGNLEVLLAHPGGPLYTNKDNGYWSIPKGHVEPNETIPAAALREFTEETGLTYTGEKLFSLGKITERNGKRIYIWAFCGNCNPALPVNSNLFEMEWPPASGQRCFFPEVDRLGFFTASAARNKIELSQRAFIDRLEQLLGLEARYSKATNS